MFPRHSGWIQQAATPCNCEDGGSEMVGHCNDRSSQPYTMACLRLRKSRTASVCPQLGHRGCDATFPRGRDDKMCTRSMQMDGWRLCCSSSHNFARGRRTQPKSILAVIANTSLHQACERASACNCVHPVSGHNCHNPRPRAALAMWRKQSGLYTGIVVCMQRPHYSTLQHWHRASRTTDRHRCKETAFVA